MAKSALRPSDANNQNNAKNILSFKDLAEFDDLLTDLLLDIPFLGMKTKKMNLQYHLDDESVEAIEALGSPSLSKESSCCNLFGASASSSASSSTVGSPLQLPKEAPNAKVIMSASDKNTLLFPLDDDDDETPVAIIEGSATRRSRGPYYTQLLAVRRNSVDVDAVATVIIDLIYSGIRHDKNFERTAAALVELLTKYVLLLLLQSAQDRSTRQLLYHSAPSETLQELFLPYTTALADKTPKQLSDLKT